jgi:hypothetical protein
MIYNVIPVNYSGGLGGQFLSSFLHAARENRSINWIFSPDGNAHDSDKDWGSAPYGIGRDPTGEKNIAHLIEYAKIVPEGIIAYPHGHYPDPDLLMQYVDKQIKIYIAPEQLDETMGVFMLKHPATRVHFQNLTDPLEQEKYKKHPMLQWRKFALTKFGRLYNSCPDLEPRMLNISWNDMLYYDPEILISKLHDFTQIPKENFNRDKFAEWRMLTHKTVNRLKEANLI